MRTIKDPRVLKFRECRFRDLTTFPMAKKSGELSVKSGNSRPGRLLSVRPSRREGESLAVPRALNVTGANP